MKCYIPKTLIFSNNFSVLINLPKIVQKMNSNEQELWSTDNKDKDPVQKL